MNAEAQSHWNRVYTTKAADAVSWYQARPRISLELIAAANLPVSAPIVDIGGGASELVDCLLDAGRTALTVLDISGAALDVARKRLGARAGCVRWIQADVREFAPPQRYDLWHDRAVFHFLTDAAQRHAYVERVLQSVKPGGHVIVATFAEDGPDRCSGLPVMRYGADTLHAEFGAPFELLEHSRETHHTPGGAVQQFVYCYCRRSAS